jgi:4'-phosphopantetheinyl transferase EntD
MIETLAPASPGAELFADVPEWTMFPAEAAAISGAVAGRRLEFASVRRCASLTS